MERRISTPINSNSKREGGGALSMLISVQLFSVAVANVFFARPPPAFSLLAPTSALRQPPFL